MNEKEKQEYIDMLSNKPMDNLLSMESRLSLWEKDLTAFIRWYENIVENNGKLTKKMFAEKALSYSTINGTWMGYMCRTCKKSEVPDAIKRLRVELYKYRIQIYWLYEELKVREYKKYNDKLKKEVVAKLLNKLYNYVELNPSTFSNEEVGCLTELIESGSIRTSSQLAKYGVN